MLAIRMLSVFCLCILYTTYVHAGVPYFYPHQQYSQIVVPYNYEQRYTPIPERTSYYRQPENYFFTSLPHQQIYQREEYIQAPDNPQQNDFTDDNLKKAPIEMQDQHFNEQFVGYAYRNEHNDGSQSNVIYFTGLNVDHQRAVNIFMQRGNVNNITDLARTAASNSLDPHAKYEFDITSNDSPMFHSLENPNPFLQTFYSLNHNLISRSENNPETQVIRSENLVVPLLSRSNLLEDALADTNETTTTATKEATSEAMPHDTEETTNDTVITLSAQNATSQNGDLKTSDVDQTTTENVTVQNGVSMENITSENVTNTIK